MALATVLLPTLVAADQPSRPIKSGDPYAASRAKPAALRSKSHAARMEAMPTATWLWDLVDRMLAGPVPSPHRAIATRPKRAPMLASVTPRIAAPVAKPIDPVETGSYPATITKGAVQPTSAAASIDISEAILRDAGKAQAGRDLVKLELAARTYGEKATSGQIVFQSRPDWRLLERAQDSLSSPELNIAEAAGFEANTYVNDREKVITVAIAGTQDLKRGLIEADIWHALIKAEAPQQFFLAKSYMRTVVARYQQHGYSTECVGHSLGGGACAYAAAELGLRGIVVNPISAGKSSPAAKTLITNYIVDGDIAMTVYGARGHEFGGDIHIIDDGRREARRMLAEKFGALAGPVLIIQNMGRPIENHRIDRALDALAAHSGEPRVK
jgi:hypothetical protein